MKKIFTIISTLCLSVLLSVSAFASENISSNTNDSNLFVTEDIANDLSERLNPNKDSYEFIFEKTDVVFDFEHAIPIYRIANFNQTTKANTLKEMLEFSGIYTLPVNDSSGMYIGSVELTDENGLWTICTFNKNDAFFASFLNDSSNMLSNPVPAYFVEIIPLQEIGLLFSDGINESFVSSVQTSQRSTNSSSSLIDEIYEASSSEDYNEGFYRENLNISFQYVFIAIICISLTALSIRVKKCK